MKKILLLLFVTVVMFSVSIGSKTEYNKITDNVKNAIDYSTTDRLIVYVYFNDKGPDVNKYLSNPLSLVSQKSLDRRRKVLPEDKLVDFTDEEDKEMGEITSVRYRYYEKEGEKYEYLFIKNNQGKLFRKVITNNEHEGNEVIQQFQNYEAFYNFL